MQGRMVFPCPGQKPGEDSVHTVHLSTGQEFSSATASTFSPGLTTTGYPTLLSISRSFTLSPKKEVLWEGDAKLSAVTLRYCDFSLFKQKGRYIPACKLPIHYFRLGGKQGGYSPKRLQSVRQYIDLCL